MSAAVALRLVAVASIAVAVVPAARAEVTVGRRASGAALAVVPGVAVPGLGAWWVGQPRAARRLAALRGVGLGLMLVGGVPLLVTYGSGKLVVPGVPMVVVGSGLFLGGWWSDVATAIGTGRGAPSRRPATEVRALLRAWRDPYHGWRALTGATATARRGRWRGDAHGEASIDRSAWVAGVAGAARLWDREDRDVRTTSTAIDAIAAIDLTRERGDGVTTTTGTVAARGRLPFAELDPALAGSFVEVDVGVGLELAAYRAGEPELLGVLVGRFAWGLYLPCDRGEVAVFYDHRRDTLAGGLPAGRAAGFFGSVGAVADLALTPGWNLSATAEFGSAWLTTVAVGRGWR